MVTLACILFGWVAFYQVGIWRTLESSSRLDHPPELFVDLQTASEEELQLLPDVGKKTARAWRNKLDESFVVPPRSAKELEALPNIGPIRSSKLAPYLVELEAHSTSSLDPSVQSGRPLANP